MECSGRGRGAPHHAIAQESGGAIAADLELTVEDSLSREEIVVGLTKLVQRLLEADWPVA